VIQGLKVARLRLCFSVDLTEPRTHVLALALTLLALLLHVLAWEQLELLAQLLLNLEALCSQDLTQVFSFLEPASAQQLGRRVCPAVGFVSHVAPKRCEVCRRAGGESSGEAFRNRGQLAGTRQQLLQVGNRLPILIGIGRGEMAGASRLEPRCRDRDEIVM
jgi:hypothetical protein